MGLSQDNPVAITPLDFELTANGLLLRPGFHDGSLLGIEILKAGNVRLTMETASGERFFVELEGVEHLLCNEFRQGNIVSAVIITTGREPYGESLRSLFATPHPSVQEPHVSEHETFVERVRSSIKEGRSIFFEVSSSYGCEIFCLCASVRILPIVENSWFLAPLESAELFRNIANFRTFRLKIDRVHTVGRANHMTDKQLDATVINRGYPKTVPHAKID
jgi:hypothetical protein